jgi:hypothetical protein
MNIIKLEPKKTEAKKQPETIVYYVDFKAKVLINKVVLDNSKKSKKKAA